MTTYTRPLGGGTPTTGQVVKAVHVNDPIDQIYDTILAGGITSDQIAVGAVDTSELATAAVTAVKMDGTLPDGSAMATSAAPTTDKQLANKLYVDDNTKMVPAITGAGTGYAGEESVTFSNGLIFKQGISVSITNNSSADVTYAVSFPGGVISVSATPETNGGAAINEAWVANKHATTPLTKLTIGNRSSLSHTFNWQAWGH